MDTIDYYNKNAVEYYQSTVDVDMSSLYQKFLQYVEDEGHILDAGCGSGRDSLYFLKQGYQVTAVDASRELVRLSSELLGQKVLQVKFQELEFKEEFDGIWACASLLHISREEIKAVLGRLLDGLKNQGTIYMSFKYGDCEVIKDGRLFNYYDENSFMELKNKFEELEIIETWKTIDAREKRTDEYWFNVIGRKE